MSIAWKKIKTCNKDYKRIHYRYQQHNHRITTNTMYEAGQPINQSQIVDVNSKEKSSKTQSSNSKLTEPE